MKNIILSIGKVEPGLVAAAKRISDELGIETKGIHLVDTAYKKTLDYQADKSGYFEEIELDFNDKNALQTIIKPIQDQILVVNCRDESTVQDFAKVVPFLPYVATPNESSLQWATVKSLMRERLSSYNETLVPAFRTVEKQEVAAIHETVTGMEYPLIVKPCGLNSSILVTKCENEQELVAALNKTFSVIEEIYKKERGSGRPQVLIEEFMVGDMYSTDAYISPDGKIWCLPPVRVTTSHDVGLPGFYGYEFQIPTELRQEELEDLTDTAMQSVRALNLRACTAHIELYNCNGKWKIIELGPRIGGHREDLYREAYGVDHYYNDLASRIDGLEPIIPKTPRKYAICMDLYPEQEGIIEAFVGLEEARQLTTCVYASNHADVGMAFYSAENGSPYAASALFSGTDKQQVIDDAAKARKIIKINTRQF